MSVIERWECGVGHSFNPGFEHGVSLDEHPQWCAGCRGFADVERVEYVRAEQLAGAVERIETIATELRAPFAMGDFIPATVEDALNSLAALAADLRGGQ